MPDRGDFSYALREARVVFAEGSLSRLPETIHDTLGSTRVLLVATPGRAAVVKEAKAVLGDAAVAVFDGARLHVPTTVVEVTLRVIRESDPDCVVTIGGGSAIGLGKALVKETGLPLAAVPTTYSGSEMTDIWGVTDGDRKRTGRDGRVAPRLVIYDPRLTWDLPADITGPSGMNAIAHSVEALYSSTANPVASLLAADGIRRVAASLPLLVSHAGDRSARRDALLGAHFCGRALGMTSMGLHHKLCHVLGGMLGLPHALTHAVVLPYATAYNAASAPDAMRTVAEALGASNAALGLWELNRVLGITHTLGDLGVQSRDVDQVVEQVTSQSYPNPAPVTASGVRGLLEQALAGDRPGPAGA